MGERGYSYDSECERLAEHFLQDRPTAYPLVKRELAQAIQDAVENWFAEREEPRDGEAWSGGFAENH